MIQNPPRDPRRHGYARVKANTAQPAERVVLMYDGIVKHLNMAMEAFAIPPPESLEQIHDHLSKAGLLVTELRLALDMDADAKLGSILAGLYDFWIEEISQANVEKKPRRLREVIEMVDNLREAWQQVSEGAHAR